MIKAIFIILTLAGYASGAEFGIPGTLSVSGCAEFKSSVSFAGDIKISSSALCSTGTAGTIRWDSGHFYGCDGAAWHQLDNALPPAIISINPSSGPASGGTVITVTGSNFDSEAVVKIGTLTATTSFVSTSALTATTPAGLTPEAKTVKVLNPDGQYAVLANTFTYFADGSGQVFALASCKAIKDANPAAASGVYWIDTNGGSTSDAFQVYCDMTRSGGGWTVVFGPSNTINNCYGTTEKTSGTSGSCGPTGLYITSSGSSGGETVCDFIASGGGNVFLCTRLKPGLQALTVNEVLYDVSGECGYQLWGGKLMLSSGQYADMPDGTGAFGTAHGFGFPASGFKVVQIGDGGSDCTTCNRQLTYLGLR